MRTLDPFVVSFTTHSARIGFLSEVLGELAGQTLLPSLVVVNLPLACPAPRISFTALPFAVQINQETDLGPATKLLPTMRRYPTMPIVTIDDDVVYRADLFEEIMAVSKKFPRCRVAGQARMVPKSRLARLTTYFLWPKVVNRGPRVVKGCLPLGCEGVLYPANTFHSNVHDESLLLQVCPSQDDLWFWAHGELSKSQTIVLPFRGDSPRRESSEETGLWRVNRQENNKAFQRLLELSPLLTKVGYGAPAFIGRTVIYFAAMIYSGAFVNRLLRRSAMERA